MTAAQESLQLWGSGGDARIDFAELDDDIAIEAIMTTPASQAA